MKITTTAINNINKLIQCSTIKEWMLFYAYPERVEFELINQKINYTNT